jgi:hypothetical protein
MRIHEGARRLGRLNSRARDNEETAMNTRLLLAPLLTSLAGLAAAQAAFPQVPGAPAFAYEEKDWGIAPIAVPKRMPVHGPTPVTLPGARVIKTLELKALLAQSAESW